MPFAPPFVASFAGAAFVPVVAGLETGLTGAFCVADADVAGFCVGAGFAVCAGGLAAAGVAFLAPGAVLVAVVVVGFALEESLLDFAGVFEVFADDGWGLAGAGFTAAEPLLAGGLAGGGFFVVIVVVDGLAAGFDEGVVVFDTPLTAGVAVPAALLAEFVFDVASFLGATDGAELMPEAALEIGGLDGLNFAGAAEITLAGALGLRDRAAPANDGARVLAGVEGKVLTVPLLEDALLDIVRTEPYLVFSSVFILSQNVPRAPYSSP